MARVPTRPDRKGQSVQENRPFSPPPARSCPASYSPGAPRVRSTGDRSRADRARRRAQPREWGMEGRRICRTARNLRERKQSPARQRWGTALARFYVPVARRIMLRMTRHKHAQTGLVTPSPLDHWIDAMLRVLVMLVSNVASTLQMIRRPDRVNATRATPAVLPRDASDTIKEYHLAAQHRSPLALILRIAKRSSRRSERRSAKRTNWSGGPIRAANAGAIAKAGVLTTLSHTSPSPSVSLTTSAIHLPLLRMGRQDQSNEGELPPSVRRTGGGGSPRLRGETEGARPVLRH